MNEKTPVFFSLEEFVPSLREAVEEEAFDLKKMIQVALPIKEPHPSEKPWRTEGSA